MVGQFNLISFNLISMVSGVAPLGRFLSACDEMLCVMCMMGLGKDSEWRLSLSGHWNIIMSRRPLRSRSRCV